ncbi:hypothetical protein BKA83DRAFT_4320632, partial [Pisolithus microcarpus]
VGIAYLGHFCAVPLAFLHGGTARFYLPGDTSLVAARSMVGTIRVFLVPDGPIGIIPFSPSRPRCLLPLPTFWYRLPQRSLLGGLLFSPSVLPCTLSTLYLPQFVAEPLAFRGRGTSRRGLSGDVC